MTKPRFFPTPGDFRKWLEKHHDKESELLVGFYKKDSGKPSMTWPESVEQALCFGWIDGVRKRLDDGSYSVRFTPRRPGSMWSLVNIRKVAELNDRGLMRPAGLRAFEARREDRSGLYSFETRPQEFPPQFEKKFRANKKAWKYFSEQPPGYRRLMIHYVISAKRDETRERRLARLIDDSAMGRRLAEYTLEKRQSRSE